MCGASIACGHPHAYFLGVPQDVTQDDLDARIIALIKKDGKISAEKLSIALGSRKPIKSGYLIVGRRFSKATPHNSRFVDVRAANRIYSLPCDIRKKAKFTKIKQTAIRQVRKLNPPCGGFSVCPVKSGKLYFV